MATHILNQNNQEAPLSGGNYVNVSTFFNGGTASLELKFNGSSSWADVGELTITPQKLWVPESCSVRALLTGSASIEVSE